MNSPLSPVPGSGRGAQRQKLSHLGPPYGAFRLVPLHLGAFALLLCHPLQLGGLLERLTLHPFNLHLALARELCVVVLTQGSMIRSAAWALRRIFDLRERLSSMFALALP